MDVALSERDVRRFCAEHEALRAFVGKRAGAPEVGDLIKGIEPYGRYRSLHHGRCRGVTVWDAAADVCWFVAYSETHASGEDRDCYRYFMRLGERDELLPTAEDYEQLAEVSTEDVLHELAQVARNLYREARARPGVEANASHHDGKALMLVDLVVIDTDECEQGWLALRLPPEITVEPGTIVDFMSQLLPEHVGPESIEVAGTVGTRPCHHEEVAWSWIHYGAAE